MVQYNKQMRQNKNNTHTRTEGKRGETVTDGTPEGHIKIFFFANIF